VVWNCPMSDLDLFLSMDRENREREDLSAYEQGMSYLAAIEGGLFPSQRRLAEALGVSHTWIRKAMMVAQLPESIIAAFASPLEVQPKHAEAVRNALECDAKAVLSRAEKLRQGSLQLTAGQVVARLIGQPNSAADAGSLDVGGKVFGTWRREGRRRAVLSIDLGAIDKQSASAIGDALAATLASMTPST